MWNSVQDGAPDSLRLILAANKVDLVPEDHDYSEVEEWANAHEVQWMKTSAKSGKGVRELFNALADGLCSPEVRAKFQANLELPRERVARRKDEPECC
jgi:50S ribosomal subunit-associated GTPase HflX